VRGLSVSVSGYKTKLETDVFIFPIFVKEDILEEILLQL
jgi:hypothetical protein